MAPKIAAPVKGQTNLFSFFNKPKISVTPTVPSEKSIENQENDKGVNGSTDLKNRTESNSEAPSCEMTSASGPVSKKRRVSVQSDDEEWDTEDDVVHKNNDSDDDDASLYESEGGSETGDDNDEEEDDLVDSDEDSVAMNKKRSRLRKAATKKSSCTSKKSKLATLQTTAKKPPSKLAKRYDESDTGTGSSLVTPGTALVASKSISSSSSTPAGWARVSPASTASFSSSGTTPLVQSASSPWSTAGGSGLVLGGWGINLGGGVSSVEGGMPPLPEGVVGQGSHEHNFFEWLKPANRRDKKGRKPEHPDYNPRTVLVPDLFLKQQTPAMCQWWQFKSENMDTVLFFKVGKFYELFHMDADVGMSELDLIYMKGSKAHSGFPEVSYGKFSSILVSKGYRVARVEQTETPEMLKERNDNCAGKKDKVVARELCSVMSKGTRTYCHLDDLSLLEDGASNSGSSVLFCIIEKPHSTSAATKAESHTAGECNNASPVTAAATATSLPEYGVCCIDTVVGTVTLAQFQDDRLRSRLRTMLARYLPSEVLLEAGAEVQSAETLGAIRLLAPGAAVENLKGPDEAPAAAAVIPLLEKGRYFEAAVEGRGEGQAKQGKEHWPMVLQAVLQGLHDGSSDLVMRALGGALWQLRRSLIDFEILSMRRFYAYVPPDESMSSAPAACASHSDTDAGDSSDSAAAPNIFTAVGRPSGDVDGFITSSSDTDIDINITKEEYDSTRLADEEPFHMTLDAIALANLEILCNNFDRTERGSLWSFLNRTKTAFGQRLLKDWVCKPLYRHAHIGMRAAAVEELLTALNQQADSARSVLKGVPDLERLLSRVHSNGIRKDGAGACLDHPDSRAVMYESNVYNARKIRDFADILTGFEAVARTFSVFDEVPVSSLLLTKVVKQPRTSEGVGKFPMDDVKSLLSFFRSIFDEKQAKKDGSIKPKPGVNQAYDEAKADIVAAEQAFEEYLRDVKRKTGISDLKFFGSNKDRFQIEVPMAYASKVPRDWTTKSQKKTHRRYWTSFIEEKFAELCDAENRIEAAQGDTLRRIFERFDGSVHVWAAAVACAAQLDALLSLASVSSAPGYCWPVIMTPSQQVQEHGVSSAVLCIKAGRHPMLELSFSQRGEGEYIPNDVSLGGTLTISPSDYIEYQPKLLLLSGPNMGGKSTLLRQTCLITIMAQLGCKVPASECRMSPVDRIFTRVGASDRILAGQSTFFVELAETAAILKFSTSRSLCILDELGRGTATFDGTAIAHAVVDHLLRKTRCRALFATHYHSLVDDWEMDPRVQLGHMDCIVSTPNDAGVDSSVTAATSGNDHEEEVTFLYRLCNGSSPKSYGINVAKLAKLPEEVLSLARKRSQQFEERVNKSVSSDVLDSGRAELIPRQTRLRAFFEKLVSVVHSDMTMPELIFSTSELWRRLKPLSI